ncbi:MAG: hypothetical protein KG028_05100 [Actinobacteria bacterium]|jgi:hypothetical protein|nr:hypothetical protein [Actinomycetota bacterium]
MGILKSAMMFKAGQAIFNRVSNNRSGATRPQQAGARRRPGGRSTGGGLGRLAQSVLGGGRRR